MFIFIVNYFVIYGRSFGHLHAKSMKVNEGFRHLDEKAASAVKHGFCVTRKSVLKVRLFMNSYNMLLKHFRLSKKYIKTIFYKHKHFFIAVLSQLIFNNAHTYYIKLFQQIRKQFRLSFVIKIAIFGKCENLLSGLTHLFYENMNNFSCSQSI